MDMFLKMPFLALSNANIRFADKELEWKNYLVQNALFMKKKLEIINKK